MDIAMDIRHTEMSRSAKTGDNENVIKALDEGANINYRGYEGRAALHYAAEGENLELVKLLLQRKAKVDIESKLEDDWNATPLHLAAKKGNCEVLETLIKAGANREAKDKGGRRAVHFASMFGHLEALKLLFRYGCSIHPRKNDQTTCLHLATAQDDISIVEWLIDNGVQYDMLSQEKLAEDVAKECGHRKIEDFLKLLGNPSSRLIYFAERGISQMVLKALSEGANVNYIGPSGMAVLHIAAKRDNFHLAKLLVARKADVDLECKLADDRGATPLHLAAKMGNSRVIEVLIKAGAKMETAKNGKRRAVHYAAMYGQLKALKMLHKFGCDLVARTSDQNTTLHLAAAYGDLGMVQWLVENGVPYDLEWEGKLPVDVARECEHGDVEKFLDLLAHPRCGLNATSCHLKVCQKYNSSVCRSPKCSDLHLCYSFAKANSTCSCWECLLNHDILDSQCCHILKAAGIAVSGYPRAILTAFARIITLKNSGGSETGKSKAVWSHFFEGDVDIDEICHASVESQCNNENTGCQRLHSKQHYHWQVKKSGNRWLNLQLHQVISLEHAFCDVSNNGRELPPVNSSLDGQSIGTIRDLLGNDTWFINFKTMKATNSTNAKTLLVRRLSSEWISREKSKPSIFVWYFLDKKQNWVEYGKVDTLGAVKLVSPLNSQDIENIFLMDSSTPLTFSNLNFSYTLCFKNMIQINHQTRVIREVRRRPMKHLKDVDDNNHEDKKYTDFPAEWEPFQPEERMKRVIIPKNSEEYAKVVQLLGKDIPPNKILKLERVQNRFQWNAFKNKIEEMAFVYRDSSKVDIRQLFHGTNPDVVSKICSENFDHRLHGISTGQVYGQGTYFATDVRISYKYCKADTSGLKFLFVARVAVGSFAVGNAKMTRPPINPNTGEPCDSTVDRLQNPSIIVKYDKSEYYPQYIFTLK